MIRTMAVNEKIYIGSSVDEALFEFGVNQIGSISFNNSVDLINNELSSDALETDIFYDDTNEALRNVAYATPLFYYSNDRLVSKYYVSKVERIDIKKYRIYATSLIGLIENEDFYGGFYSGTQFEEVVNDILFSNGVNLTKYNIYYPETYYTSSQSITPVKLYDGEDTVNGWKYRIHLEFVFLGEYRTISGSRPFSNIAGCYKYQRQSYYVQTTSNQTSAGNVRLDEVRITYGSSSLYVSYSNCAIGVGSKIIVDVNPLAGTMLISVDYVDPDDNTITGHFEKSANITVSTSTEELSFNYGYGGTNSGAVYKYSVHLQWEKFQVYDENGNPIIDAMFATNDDGSIYYVANPHSNYVVETTSFRPYGNRIAIVNDFSRIDRDNELKQSLMYGSGVATLPIRGWINICTRREALHQLLFAENVNMLKTEDGKILFTTLPKASTGEIPEGSMFDNSVEQKLTGAKKISITEHSYETSGVTAEKIFDNSSAIAIEGQYLAVFDKAPIFGTPTGSGITILHSNCNAALVTGRGTITGTPYRHSQSVIQYVGNVADGTDISVSNIGIITSLNSDNVMNKLKNYYSGNLKKISNDIEYGGQRCGLIYEFKNLFRNSNTGFLTKLASIASSFVRSMCEFISGYTPPSAGGYGDYTIVTYGNEWTVPDSVKSQDYPNIRINLIGKGHDGTAGSDGSAGTMGNRGDGCLPGGSGGAGGAAGTGGDGGDIYSVTVDVTNITKIAVSNSGYNTIVKTYNGSTLVSTYSSASGNKADNGFTNLFTGIIYARKGSDGVAGGAGGAGGYWTTSNGGKYVAPGSGAAIGNNSGGTSFPGETFSYQSVGGTSYNYCSYGGGGGAAYGANGGNAVRSVDWGDMISTDGGAGANAAAPANVYTEYGSGGFGGNGGGGGGGGGTRYSDFAAYNPSTGQYYRTYETWPQANGGRGTGSAGTAGIEGCAIIYY